MDAGLDDAESPVDAAPVDVDAMIRGSTELPWST
jgi:hypothetical protein